MPDYCKTKYAGWKCCINSAFSDPRNFTRLPFADNEDGIRGPYQKIQSSKHAIVYKCKVNFFGRANELYVKRYLYRNTTDFLKHFFRKSRASRAFQAHLMLKKNGFDTPFPCAAIEKKFGPIKLRNSLIIREVKNTTPLYAFFESRKASQLLPSRQKRSELIKAMGRTVGKLHQKHIGHGDLRAGNILVKYQNQNWQFYFIDNERTKQYKNLPVKVRLKNLVQLNLLKNISATDKMRFFREYTKENANLVTDSHRLASAVIEATKKRLSNR
jgi:tRNA A-37 threonylcarbamoyl transferase component Bud32